MPGSQLFAQHGRVTMVVGAGSEGGIGFACASLLAELGGEVALADLADSRIEALAAKLPGPGRHSARAIDVRDPHSVKGAVEAVAARHGRLDGVVIAHGILRNEPFLDMTIDAWDATFEVNCRGVMLVAQAAARHMANHGGGRIVAVSSNAGRVPRLATSSYGAAKAAVIHLVHCMALELGKHGITVNALCPGSTATSMTIENMAGGDPKKLEGVIRGSVEQWRTGIPLGKLAEPRDQAAMTAFLLSDAGRHITGQAICVDGGQTFF